MSRQEKKEVRIERYNELARKAKDNSQMEYDRSNQEVKGIPFGQPILVGHHSEKRHRATLEKSHIAMRRSIEESNKADYYRAKAKAAENNDAIYSEDEDALERLEEKIANLEAAQQMMKDRNKVFKSKKLTDEQKIEKLIAMGMESTQVRCMLEGDFCGRVGYADFNLTNNSANIRAAKKRLEKVRALQGMEEKEYEINGVSIKENPKQNRFQIFFDGKPSEEIRQKLIKAGYRWARGEGCWQCYFNHWNIDAGKKILEEM